jgi:hypothetical protein
MAALRLEPLDAELFSAFPRITLRDKLAAQLMQGHALAR